MSTLLATAVFGPDIAAQLHAQVWPVLESGGDQTSVVAALESGKLLDQIAEHLDKMGGGADQIVGHGWLSNLTGARSKGDAAIEQFLRNFTISLILSCYAGHPVYAETVK